MKGQDLSPITPTEPLEPSQKHLPQNKGKMCRKGSRDVMDTAGV